MYARPKFLVFLAACMAGLIIFQVTRFLIDFSRPGPTLNAYLSKHELVIPSNSNLFPNILREKLSRDAFQGWLRAEAMENDKTERVLQEILRYLTVSIFLDLPDDSLTRYNHYYLLKIENNSEKLFENVYVKFPSIEAVEVRRRRQDTTMAPLRNGRYLVGDIGPNETVDVYAWHSRPFYLQEENGIVLRHGNTTVQILKMELVKPGGSWVKDNLLLVALLGILVLFFTQKMVFVIRMCSKNLDPKIGKRINIE